MDKQDNFNLAKAYEPQEYEAEIYRLWEESGFFNPDNLSEGKESFTISMPPPNATGILHLGHASTLAYQDLMIRYQRLRGKKTLWLPGTDHAAIATQTKVEKILAEKGVDRHSLGREKFLEKVKEYVADSQGTIRNQIRKIGSSCDWSREAYTFSDSLSVAVNEAFVRMYNDGLIYRGYRIVNWCPRCASTLADDEVEYQEQLGKLYYIKYGPFVVATTRPETKLADTGVAVNPEDTRYQDYLGQVLEIDLAGHKIKVKVFADAQVDSEFGSGVVGVTPAHSAVDYDFAQKNDLEIIKLIDEQGKIMSTGGKYAGLTVLEAREKFVKDLEAAGQIEKIEDLENNLSICYRCDTPIEPLTSEQWFVAVDKKIPGRDQTLKELAIQAVKNKEIKIVPDRFSKVYYHWMENLHDWCISRQIWWGHQIPVWYSEDQKMIVAISEEDALKKAGGQKIARDPDTLDTWFSSSLWTFSTLGWPEKTKDLDLFHPTSVMETGYDILFFWVARMILMSEYLLESKPFETVYLHGMIRDKEGKKMSKSLGNGIDPIEMIEKFGTDALRLSLIIGSSPGADLRLYEEKIEGYRNFVNKLWNISRFVFSQVGEIKITENLPKTETLADAWILAEFNLLIKEVTENLETFKFSLAGEKLYEFTWSKFADWYLEVAKIEKNKDEILLYILPRLLTIWHPFTPFVTEVIWEQFKSDKFLMINQWPKADESNQEAQENFKDFIDLVTQIRNIKAENKIPPVEFVDCYLESQVLSSADLEVVAKLGRVNLKTEEITGENFASFKSRGQIKAAKAMTEKEKEDLEKYIKSLEAKLGNKAFVENAPPEVVADNQKRLEEAKQKLAN
ncbi:valine--tRNA ligase [Candidatus Nomurabacteria bacterium]|nr:valine--tRNA ligase [Candidatus Nomurabacteria bacterium]